MNILNNKATININDNNSSVNETNLKNKQSIDKNKIFVGGIHIGVDEDELRSCFNVLDEVQEVILMRDRETNKSRGFAFITFTSERGVEKALSNKDFTIRDRTVVFYIIICR